MGFRDALRVLTHLVEMHRPGIQASPLGLDLLLPFALKRRADCTETFLIHSFFIRYTFIECGLCLTMVLHLGKIKTRTKVSVLPWYKDTVKGNILFVGTRAPNWPGAGSHG